MSTRSRHPSVSIHAPAKGATGAAPTAHMYMLFRSTPPRRGRLLFFDLDTVITGFDPRPREGGDRRPGRLRL